MAAERGSGTALLPVLRSLAIVLLSGVAGALLVYALGTVLEFYLGTRAEESLVIPPDVVGPTVLQAVHATIDSNPLLGLIRVVTGFVAALFTGYLAATLVVRRHELHALLACWPFVLLMALAWRHMDSATPEPQRQLLSLIGLLLFGVAGARLRVAQLRTQLAT